MLAAQTFLEKSDCLLIIGAASLTASLATVKQEAMTVTATGQGDRRYLVALYKCRWQTLDKQKQARIQQRGSNHLGDVLLHRQQFDDEVTATLMDGDGHHSVTKRAQCTTATSS